MLARIFSRVLLPEPFRPTIPKNSPRRRSNEIPRRAWSWRYSMRANGCTARSLNEVMRWLGIRNAFSTPLASITTGASAPGADAVTMSAVSAGSVETPADMGERVRVGAGSGARQPALEALVPEAVDVERGDAGVMDGPAGKPPPTRPDGD